MTVWSVTGLTSMTSLSRDLSGIGDVLGLFVFLLLLTILISAICLQMNDVGA